MTHIIFRVSAAYAGNRADLERELGDLYDVVGLMLERGDLHAIPIHGHERKLRYAHHQADDLGQTPEDHLPVGFDREALYHADALARAECKNLDGSPRRECRSA